MWLLVINGLLYYSFFIIYFAYFSLYKMLPRNHYKLPKELQYKHNFNDVNMDRIESVIDLFSFLVVKSLLGNYE